MPSDSKSQRFESPRAPPLYARGTPRPREDPAQRCCSTVRGGRRLQLPPPNCRKATARHVLRAPHQSWGVVVRWSVAVRLIRRATRLRKLRCVSRRPPARPRPAMPRNKPRSQHQPPFGECIDSHIIKSDAINENGAMGRVQETKPESPAHRRRRAVACVGAGRQQWLIPQHER